MSQTYTIVNTKIRVNNQTNQRQYRLRQENTNLQHCHAQPLSPTAFIPLHKTSFLSLHSDSLRNWSPPLATNRASLHPNVVLSSTLNAHPHIIWHTRIRRRSNRSVSHTPDRYIHGCVVAGAVMAGRCWRIALWREEWIRVIDRGLLKFGRRWHDVIQRQVWHTEVEQYCVVRRC